MNKRSFMLFFAVVTLTLIGCGPKVKLSPTYEKVQPTTLALLPIKQPKDVRVERIAFLRKALRASLQSRDFYLLDEKLIDRYCSDVDCSGRSELFRKHNVDGIVRLELESISRNNFALGFYNAIDGTLIIEDAQGNELFSVTHTQSERGGLVFESGQVIQGIRETIDNVGDDSYNLLAGKFADTIVEEIPAPTDIDNLQEVQAKIGDVTSDVVQPGIHQICVRGSRDSLASLVINKTRANLREVSPGQYCGIYRLNPNIDVLAVELRSAFGNPVRGQLSITPPRRCDLDGFVSGSSDGTKNQLEVECVSFANDLARGIDAPQCKRAQSCLDAKVSVFRSTNGVGRFLPAGDITTPVWTDPKKQAVDETTYHVVTVSQDGIVAPPVSVNVATTQ